MNFEKVAQGSIRETEALGYSTVCMFMNIIISINMKICVCYRGLTLPSCDC